MARVEGKSENDSTARPQTLGSIKGQERHTVEKLSGRSPVNVPEKAPYGGGEIVFNASKNPTDSKAAAKVGRVYQKAYKI